MASADFPKGSREWEMIGEFWAICKKYWFVEDTDKWWKEVTEATNEFVRKYGRETYPRCIMGGFIRNLEEQARSLRKAGSAGADDRR